MSGWVTGFAPAKVNLALHVVGQRSDGFHLLESLVVFAGVGDGLAARASAADSLFIDGPFAQKLPVNGQNLVLSTIAAFRGRFPARLPDGIEVRLTKNLPVAAGVGGGSADAAAMLRTLEQVADKSVPRSEMEELAAQLGADVPVCLSDQPQLMQGTGEKTHPVSGLPRAHFVLINPRVPASTQAVFSKLVSKNNAPMPALPESFPDPQALADWLKTTRNDLAHPAHKLVPQIEEITSYLEQQPDCLFARMSGSGATVFGLFNDEQQAALVAKVAQEHWPQYWVVSAPMLK